jgi:adenylate cyclase
MLQRVAQHLGIALDKKSKLEQEEKLRLLFQKYVPAQVLNGSLVRDEPVLGAKSTDVTCMFIDIRGFTKLSESFPTEVVLDILNRFFSLVQSVVKENGGIIDKFLGDGVLALWGMAPNKTSHTLLAVRAASDILKKLEILNKDLVSSSLPSIDIGIGINTGFALVGNVGSEERMEHTAIGPTVNLASRLEGLCKVYKSNVIVSEAVLKKLDKKELENWNVKNNVEVKGIDQTINIGTMKKIEGM